ncbi:hypothetical protein F4861DRAFT_430349 [Xylaria intraflava]|nr:hypothetical protein F4861DRAFT_430349 [Xylaria intraflava]
MLAVLGLVLVIFSLPTVTGEASCWAPDGVTLADQSYQPCNSLGIDQQGVFSSCCRLNGNASSLDFCTSSGLCLSSSDGTLRRGYCTDKTWKSLACVDVCTDPNAGGSLNSSAEMTTCSDGSGAYCCGHNQLGCCGTKNALIVQPQADVFQNFENSHVPRVFKRATIGLAVVAGVITIASLVIITGLNQKNKAIKREFNEKTTESTMALSTHTDPYGLPKDVCLPGSPGAPLEMNMNTAQYQRFSELESRMMSAQSEMNSPVPQPPFDNDRDSSDARY